MKELFSFCNYFPELQVVTSTRSDGSMAGDTKNLSGFVTQLQLDPTKLSRGVQVHSSNVVIVTPDTAGHTFNQTDGLITQLSRVPLAVVTADCAPVVLYDPVSRTLALLHVGWRGFESEIVARTLEMMATKFQIQPATVWVGIGPAIRRCHYQVQPPFKHTLTSRFAHLDQTGWWHETEGKLYFDLPTAIKTVVLASGVPSSQIEDCGDCTADDLFRWYSYRLEQGRNGHLATVAWLDT